VCGGCEHEGVTNKIETRKRPGRASSGVKPSWAADPDSAHYSLLLNIFDLIPDFGLDLFPLAGEEIALVASDIANRFLGLALELLGARLDTASGGGGQGQGWGADGQGS